MSHKKQGQLTTSPEWARHLRPLLRRWFWKGERRAAKEVLRFAPNEDSGEVAGASVEALLNEVFLWPDSAEVADLWVCDELTLRGRVIAQDIAMAVVLDKILSRGLFPNGFSAGSRKRAGA